ncbi:rRNA maturation RNase YbeY [bacterium]|nr:rRNA maturation RNase YbeY [bacterium]|tara:strand:+ start:338 stop:775 length:438 start_codon:yes stop_codon:yes gene_type:complete
MIHIVSDNSLKEISFKKLENCILKLNNKNLIYNRQEKHTINIQLLKNKEIIELNKEFRNKDYLPDVLSFDYRQEKMFEHELSGEVFISLEKAKQQATDKKHSLNDELIFLIIHGILHVLGYDHKNDKQEAEMKNLEQAILNLYKI